MLLWHRILPNYQVTLAAGQSEGAVTGPESFEVPPEESDFYSNLLLNLILTNNELFKEMQFEFVC